jgi:hypothetical protein
MVKSGKIKTYLFLTTACAWVIKSEPFDEPAVSCSFVVGHCEVVKRPILATTPGQANDNHMLIFLMIYAALTPGTGQLPKRGGIVR